MLRNVNKRKRLEKLLRQHEQECWTTQRGKFSIPVSKQAPSQFRGQMCPSGLALHHPAAELLLEYATRGCPAKTGAQWTKEEVTAAVEHGNHSSTEVDTARIQFRAEALDKRKLGQCRIVNWDDIRDNPPAEMKVSPLSAVPHKFRLWRAILDLSYSLDWTPKRLFRWSTSRLPRRDPAGPSINLAIRCNASFTHSLLHQRMQ